MKRRIRCILPLLALLLALPATAQEPGFHLLGPGANPYSGQQLCPSEMPPFAHWDLRQFFLCYLPFEVYPNLSLENPNTGQAVLPPAGIVAEIQTAAASWTNVSPAHVSLLDVTQSPCTVPARDQRNCVAWRQTPPGFVWGNGVLGITYVWRSATTGVIQESDIVLNPRPIFSLGGISIPLTWQLTPPPGSPQCIGTQVGLGAVVVHEFGHFLGLHHSNQAANPLSCGDDDPTGATIMYSAYRDACRVNLAQGDQDGLNYLYTADLGDLDDLPYPTRVHGGWSGQTLSGVPLMTPDDGAQHLFGIFRQAGVAAAPRYQYEWLGLCCGGIDDNPGECEASGLDAFDDGALLLARCEGDKLLPHVSLLVGVRTAADRRGRVHTYDGSRPMYLNAWFDWNNDGDFQDGGEHAVGNVAGGVAVTRGAIYGFRLFPPDDAPCLVAHRVRLDYREDVGQTTGTVDPLLNRERGAAQHGEVEDYVGPYDPWGIYNQHPNRPQGPGSGWIPWSVFYCHFGESIVTFDSGMSAEVDGFCHPPKPKTFPTGSTPSVAFPDAGGECMDSTLTFNLDIDGDDKADEMIGLAGPVCVTRGAPYTDAEGYRVIDTEMVSLEMQGYSQFAGAITVRLSPEHATLGQIRQSVLAAEIGVDVSEEAPADSWFDVYYQIVSEELGTSKTVGPVRAEAQITTVPPGEPNGTIPGEEIPPDEEEVPPNGEPGDPSDDEDGGTP